MQNGFGIKHPGESLEGHLALRAKFLHNASSLPPPLFFFSCKPSTCRKGRKSLWFFLERRAWEGSLSLENFSERLPNARMISVLPRRTPAGILQFSPRSFKEQGNRDLPFSARIRLRQLLEATNRQGRQRDANHHARDRAQSTQRGLQTIKGPETIW